MSSDVGIGDGGDLEVKEEGTSEKHVVPNVRLLKFITISKKLLMLMTPIKE